MNAPFTLDAADGVELFEPCVVTPAFFSGVRLHVVRGVAHLLFYTEQPSAEGRIEFVVVARLIAPLGSAAASCEHVLKDMRRGTPMSHLPAGILPN